MTTNVEMTGHHWFRAVAAQADLHDLIDEAVSDLAALGVSTGPDSSELNRLMERRLTEHPNADLLEFCKAQGIYDAIVSASEKYDAEEARPLKVVRPA